MQSRAYNAPGQSPKRANPPTGLGTPAVGGETTGTRLPEGAQRQTEGCILAVGTASFYPFRCATLAMSYLYIYIYKQAGMRQQALIDCEIPCEQTHFVATTKR